MSIATFYTAVVNDTTSTIHGVTVYFWATAHDVCFASEVLAFYESDTLGLVPMLVNTDTLDAIEKV